MNTAHDSLVQVRGLSKTFDLSPPFLERVIARKPRALLHAVDDVSFDIPRGSTLGLVGESGCGKSTVARLLVGLYQPRSGTIRFDGTELDRATLERPEVRRRLQMIFQDPYASLNPRWRVAKIVSEPLETLHGSSRADARQETDRLLQLVGLAPSDADRFPHQFSGGQRQRISIARALAARPDFLVCDEPTSALDVSVQAQVVNLMRKLQREHGLTYLFISHNLAVIRHVSDEIGVMYLGRIIERAPRERLFARPRHPYTQLLLDAIPDLTRVGRPQAMVPGEVPNPLHPPSGCAFNPRCRFARDLCRNERPMLEADEEGTLVACHGVREHWPELEQAPH